MSGHVFSNMHGCPIVPCIMLKAHARGFHVQRTCGIYSSKDGNELSGDWWLGKDLRGTCLGSCRPSLPSCQSRVHNWKACPRLPSRKAGQTQHQWLRERAPSSSADSALATRLSAALMSLQACSRKEAIGRSATHTRGYKPPEIVALSSRLSDFQSVRCLRHDETGFGTRE